MVVCCWTPSLALGRWASLVLAILVTACWVQRGGGEALSCRLLPYERICFYQPIENDNNTKIYFYYSVQGQDQKLDVQIFDPFNKLLHNGSSEVFGDKSFDVRMKGDYSICFLNQISFANKVVDFDITVQEEGGGSGSGGSGAGEVDADGDKGGLSSSTTTAFEKAIFGLQGELRVMTTYQRFFKVRAERNRYTVGQTSGNVFYFTLFECLLIVGSAVGQVYLLKKLFTDSGKMRV